jgi:hypothetical protein
MDSITLIGITIVFFFCLTKVLKFYGIDESSYGVYLLFYILLCLCVLVLPKEEVTF